MNRRIATWAAAALTVLSLAACSGSPEAAPAPSEKPASSAPAEPAAPATTTTPATTTAPEPEPSEATVAEACVEPSAKLVEASAQLTEASAALAASDGKDAEAAVEALKGMGDYFSTLAESAANSEVGAALAGIGKGYAGLAVPYGKMLVDNDLSATDYTFGFDTGVFAPVTTAGGRAVVDLLSPAEVVILGVVTLVTR